MATNQLTILTENSAVRLGEVISHLSRENIDIRAHCLVDNGDNNCKLRMIVSEPDRAVDILQRHRFAAVVNEVVMLETDDKPGALSRLLQLFGADDIEIKYTYTAASELAGVAGVGFLVFCNRRAPGGGEGARG